MNMSWKQFVAWATGSQSNHFTRARYRLTIFYVLLMAIVLAIISLAFYYIMQEVLLDTLGGLRNSQTRQTIILHTLHHMKIDLFLVDFGVLAIYGLLGYILAGKTLNPIERALEAQMQFSTYASHEFRTPLAIIKHDLEVALKDPQLGGEEAKKVMKSNLEEVDHMSSMVEQLLKLSRNGNQVRESDMKVLDFSNIVKNTSNKIQSLAKSKGVDIRIGDLESSNVVGSGEALAGMVLNLLQNAVRYNKPGGSVTVSVTRCGKYVELLVKDTGIGIEPKDLPLIFNHFYKADNARSLGLNGSGLGLAIVQGIVSMHRGQIEVESDTGKGTTVKVELPALTG